MQVRTLSTLRVAIALAGHAGTLAFAAQATEAKRRLTRLQDVLRHSNGNAPISPQEFVGEAKDEKAFEDANANRDGRLNEGEHTRARAIDELIEADECIDDVWITSRMKAQLLKDALLTGHGGQRGNPRQGGAIGRFS